MRLMSPEEFDALCTWLDQRVQFSRTPDGGFNIGGCEGDLRLTEHWLSQHGLDVKANVEALGECGAFCDCEVLLNATTHWRDYAETIEPPRPKPQKRQRKKQGHYCRVCGRHRANEKFSGKGHARHICKDCEREQRQKRRQQRRSAGDKPTDV